MKREQNKNRIKKERKWRELHRKQPWLSGMVHEDKLIAQFDKRIKKKEARLALLSIKQSYYNPVL